MRHYALFLILTIVQSCIAPPVSDATLNDLEAATSLASSDVPSNICKDIDNCRTMASVVTSCVGTIFACIWVAVHPNIPGPKQSWKSRQFESLKVMVMTLLVPEWVLAWALRQFLQAVEYAEMLEKARRKAEEKEKERLERDRQETERLKGMGVQNEEVREVTAEILTEQYRDDQGTMDEADESSPLSNTKRSDQGVRPELKDVSRFHKCFGWVSAIVMRVLICLRGALDWIMARWSFDKPKRGNTEERSFWQKWRHPLGDSKDDASWTIAHAFFGIMGGFHHYKDGKPQFPLQVTRVSFYYSGREKYHIIALVVSRSLVPPTSDELGDKSKGDSLSKTIAVFQTLWFVIQCIARRADNLAITNLEIMTLAYTVITVAMYAAWWDKPLNVRCPVRVERDHDRGDPKNFEWDQTIDYVTGNQDTWVDLSCEERVPTFWSSCGSDYSGTIPLQADVISLSVAMVFGAVHCAAWSYAFPSLAEKQMWRACAIAIAAIPLPMAGMFAMFDPFNAWSPRNAIEYFQVTVMTLGGMLYIIARIFLLVLSFTTLRNLPLSAYQTVQWTTWIPHI